MAQLITKTNEHIKVKEDIREVFDLLQDDKQFIIVNVEYSITMDYSLTDTKPKLEIMKTAINKNEIKQAF